MEILVVRRPGINGTFGQWRTRTLRRSPIERSTLRRRTGVMPSHQCHRSATAALIALLLALGVSACGNSAAGSGADKTPEPESTVGTADTAAKGVLAYKETEFAIAPARQKAAAGEVTFKVENAGKIKHEFVVIKTPKPADALDKGDEADETGAVDEIGDIEPGGTQSLKVTLKPGHYALICNLPGHYKPSGENGMLADVTVR